MQFQIRNLFQLSQEEVSRIMNKYMKENTLQGLDEYCDKWNQDNPPTHEILRADGKTVGIWISDTLTWAVKRTSGYNPMAMHSLPPEVWQFIKDKQNA